MEPEQVADVQGDGRWMSMHKRFLSQAKEGEPEVLFVGDSLIQNLIHTDIWDKMFVPMHCLNFGIGGDQTQHVLWRLQNGELDNLTPKVVVLCVGTNDHGHSAEEVVAGILTIVDTIAAKQPQATIIVMSLPPRGQSPNPLREKIATINQSLANKLEPHKTAQFLNVDPGMFVSEVDASISHTDMHDYLHFTRQGYQKWTEPLLEEIQTLLKNFLTADSLSSLSLRMVPSTSDIAEVGASQSGANN